jgi:hypothetical protein
MVAADASRPEPPGASSHVEVVGVSRCNMSTTRSERTPLLPKPEEEVYPLPWFRSPEWTKRPPPAAARNPGRRRQGVAASRVSSACPAFLQCCYNSADAGSESDVELGLLARRPANAGDVDEDADSFKQCIQFLVGLIVIMAMALILLIIFQPKAE